MNDYNVLEALQKLNRAISKHLRVIPYNIQAIIDDLQLGRQCMDFQSFWVAVHKWLLYQIERYNFDQKKILTLPIVRKYDIFQKILNEFFQLTTTTTTTTTIRQNKQIQQGKSENEKETLLTQFQIDLYQYEQIKPKQQYKWKQSYFECYGKQIDKDLVQQKLNQLQNPIIQQNDFKRISFINIQKIARLANNQLNLMNRNQFIRRKKLQKNIQQKKKILIVIDDDNDDNRSSNTAINQNKNNLSIQESDFNIQFDF